MELRVKIVELNFEELKKLSPQVEILALLVLP